MENAAVANADEIAKTNAGLDKMSEELRAEVVAVRLSIAHSEKQADTTNEAGI